MRFQYALPSTQPYHVWRNPSMDFCCTYLHMVFPQAHVTGLIEMRPAQDCLHAYVHALQCAIQEQRVDLLEALSDSLGAFLSGNVRFVSSSPMVNQVRAFIFQHISEEIKVEELSGLQGYNPNYFIKVFSRETGMTPHQYVIQCRMQYAVDLLNRGQSNHNHETGYKIHFDLRGRRAYGSPQEPSVFRKLTVEENIWSILETRQDLTRAEKPSCPCVKRACATARPRKL